MRTIKAFMEVIVIGTLTSAIVIIALVVAARADGVYGPPPFAFPPFVRPPIVQLPPLQGCVETAIQLAYLTNQRVGLAAIAACEAFAPVRIPQPHYYQPPLGGYPNGNGYNGNGNGR